MARERPAMREGRQRSTPLVRPGLAPRQPVKIELDCRTAFDFLISTCPECGNDEELLRDDRDWRSEARAALVASLGEASFVESCLGFGTALGGFLVNHPGVRTARDVVTAVDGLSDDELNRCLFDELLQDEELGPVAGPALEGDQVAFERLQAALEQYKGHPVLPAQPAELAAVLRRALQGWLGPFETVEARIGRMLERDVASRRLDEAETDPFGFVERVTNGLRLVGEPGVRRIVLAPSYFARPYNELTRVSSTRLICYPISDDALGAADRLAPSPATVRLFRALGDETRLRLLRLLTERDWYLTELATAVELSKPTTKHHLALLRSAGLVTVTDEGNLTYYSLRRRRIEEVGLELGSYLAR